MREILISAALAFCCSGAVAACAAELQAGIAQSVITPALVQGHSVYLAGFGQNRTASGVHDDLYVRCLALAAGKRKLVLCSVDLIGLFYQDVLDIRRQFEQNSPGTFLIVSATHTHAGPDTLGLYGPAPLTSGVDPEYLEWVETRIASTAEAAAHNLEAAVLEFGRDDHPLLSLLQGVDRPPIAKDPYLFAMRVSARGNGKTIAVLVNWSDHPETLWRKNTEITSDYPHWVRTYLEQRFGGTALFFSGSLGKVSTLGQVAMPDPETGTAARDGTWRKAELVGTEIGRLAERALKNPERARVDALSIQSELVFIPLHNDLFRAAIAAGVFGDRRPLFTAGKPDGGREMRELPGMGRVTVASGHDLRSEVDYVRLRCGKATVAEIATIPGEIYPELVNGGMARYAGADFPQAAFEPALREHLLSRFQFIFGLANDEIGYLIPKAEWDEEPPWLENAAKPWYGEVNSAGPDAAGAVLQALLVLIRRTPRP